MASVTPQGEELDRIGDLGEGEFRTLCRKARLHCSKVDPDRTGKDFVVEFQLAKPGGFVSLDRRPPPIQIVVQVKTILAKNCTARLSLSVAERLAKDTRPAAVAVLRIDEQDEIVDLHLLHLMDGPLGRILKALRQASSSDTPRLHERTISFKLDPSDRVHRKAPDVYAAFAAFAGDGMLGYAAEKRRQLEELGFEPNRYNMKFSLPHAPDDITESLLGLKPLEVSDVAITERRFNIDLPWDTIKNATIEFLPTAHLKGSTTIHNFAADEPRQVVLKSDFTVVPENIFEGVPPALIARTTYGDFVIKSKTWVFSQAQEYGPGTQHTLKDWIGFIELGLILGRAEFSQMFAADGTPGTIQFDVSDMDMVFDTMQERRFLKILERLLTIAAAARWTDKSFTLSELLFQAKVIGLIAGMLKDVNATFQCRSTGDLPPNLPGDRGALVCPVNVLGNWIGFFVPIEVSTTADEDGILWTGKQSVKAVVESLDADDVEGSFEAFRRKYCELREVSLVFVQKPGDFLTGETNLIDLRAAATSL
ncbi:hypothetical protein ELH36_08535 [Rhizobium ruizarguesonis]|uniref:hypothetical protein n=1 Tax=Rhizobium ruizarguesonis TaxID=2081791 RepID=UPI0010300E67|nr:hypothetical protein [Rhizobium ruizarguesonis]TBA37484.1 hypothetical protein ELH60_08525 [Rhizobium ruizarguesonis]TBC62831.1 hypothetical protein ELH36_08535 [Rhizobium ruizarguesonis]